MHCRLPAPLVGTRQDVAIPICKTLQTWLGSGVAAQEARLAPEGGLAVGSGRSEAGFPQRCPGLRDDVTTHEAYSPDGPAPLALTLLAAPLAAQVQPAGKVHRVGFILTTSPVMEMAGPEPLNPVVSAFVQGPA